MNNCFRWKCSEKEACYIENTVVKLIQWEKRGRSIRFWDYWRVWHSKTNCLWH